MIERGETEEGLAHIRQCVEAAPSTAAWADLGTGYVVLKRYEEAESCYRSAVALAESNEDATVGHLGLFTAYKAADRVDDALSAWSMVAVLDPDMGDETFLVYPWLIERGDLDAAKRYLQREQDPNRRALYEGRIEWQAGQQSAARATWRRVLEMDIEHEEADLATWIEAALRLGEPQRALAAEEPLTQGNRSRTITDASSMLGIAYAALGEVEKAGDWLEQAVGRLRRQWPSSNQIDSAKWRLFASLVSDEDTVQALTGYFDKD
jgi:tetratricopeptide (TPR) repeat protein